jgi:UDP:flavonoid glycosyltransferase YjiC (YdhE family)
MMQAGGGWTTDLDALAATHRTLGIAPPRDGISAWEAPELVLVSAPRWLDLDCDAPVNVLHAGPLGLPAHVPRPARAATERPRVLVSFSTTVMHGQEALIERVCDAVAGLEDVDVVLTLGPAVAREAVRIPDNVTVLGLADHDRDQSFNAGRVEQLEAGIRLASDSPPDRIRTALRRLLEDRRFPAAAAWVADRIAADEPDRTAGEAIERTARHR